MNIFDDERDRPVIWIGSSRSDLANLPKPVKSSFGARLYELQRGKRVRDSKPLSQFGPSVWELRESYDKNAYRLMCVLALERAIYVLHAFMKKSKRGIDLPRVDAALIASRLKVAQRLDRES